MERVSKGWSLHIFSGLFSAEGANLRETQGMKLFLVVLGGNSQVRACRDEMDLP